MTTLSQFPEFDYAKLRTLVGAIALLLPIAAVVLVNCRHTDFGIPSSISITYHLGARDVFVGALFVVGTFLYSYRGNGLYQTQKWEIYLTNIAATAAILIAICPTSISDKEITQIKTAGYDLSLHAVMMSDYIATIHYIAAGALFIILTLFCFLFFQRDTYKKGGKAGIRSKIYITCGMAMVIAMFIGLYEKIVKTELLGLFWIEVICLVAFGISWLLAGSYQYWLDDTPPEK